MIFSAYCSPFEDLNQELIHIQNAINVLKPNNYIICVDSNSHSKVWFNDNDDQRGEQINDFLAENNLIICNEGIFGPTYQCSTGSSHIDITLCNLNTNNLINEWQILDIDSHSDHKYIYFELSAKTEKIEFYSTFKYNTKRADWESFTEDIKSALNSWYINLEVINTSKDLNKCLEKISSKLNSICDQNIPKYNRNQIRSNANKWWNSDLTAFRNRVNTERRRYQRCRTNRRQQLYDFYIQLKIS